MLYDNVADSDVSTDDHQLQEILYDRLTRGHQKGALVRWSDPEALVNWEPLPAVEDTPEWDTYVRQRYPHLRPKLKLRFRLPDRQP